ncbi:citrulline utilization hydrolase CtlX [Lacihabitans sp. CS3-21]|uniref:citrulline utilization hydrolase CtlX n=1 Tax=Lacihabitans sp. CS3-21 TaxID=2487332 RepID=UPI0020CC6A26|nr:arginine deiminase-related protein [Lacihabitans sp. CS3-21]MCP9745836.1 amidinotransferase [Lacihabitans sp. CS3-21]
MQEQITSNVLMIRPVNFNFNEQTAESNKFQNKGTDENINFSAQVAFDQFVYQLELRGINVMVIEDTPEPFTPDSIFPNNWISMHHSGKVVLYPMEAPNRREERRRDILDKIKQKYDLNVVLDFTHFEEENKFLEGTGSLVLDRMHRIAFACISSRTNPDVLAAWKKQMNYDLVTFNAFDQNQHPIYHTNVVMCMGDTFCVICLESISDLDERLLIKQKLESLGKEVIEISLGQMNEFAGNMLLLKNKAEKKFLVMSDRAFKSLTKYQIEILEDYAEIIHPDLGIIETYGGGSARCMIAEIHLPEI